MRSISIIAPLFLVAGMAFAQAPKFADELQNVDPNSTVQVIVQYDHHPTLDDHQRISNLGGTHLRSFHSLPVSTYSLSAAALNDLANNGTITHVSIDHPIHTRVDLSAPPRTSLWHRRTME